MTLIWLVALAVAFFLTFGGGLWLLLNVMAKVIYEAEAEGMRKVGGKIDESEPDLLGRFRIAQSEGDLLANKRNRPIAMFLFILGLVMLAWLVMSTTVLFL